MNIHEYQAKQVLSSHGIPVPAGMPALSVDEARQAAASLAASESASVWAVKAQIHAGGRGKAGGVRVCRSLDEVEVAAESLLGSVLVTHQTGPAGKQVRRLYVEQGLNIGKEFYLALLVDRQNECISYMISPDGGMDIEKVAADTPDRILHISAEESAGAGKMAAFLGLEGKQAAALADMATKLLSAFNERDASLIELNPLVLTAEGNLVALDAKMSFDDNALYRQQEIAGLRDPHEEDPREAEAAEHDLSYIELDGDIGCMVNGAGLAMATMDIIQLKGERPANFLDVGGGVTEDAVTEGFHLLFANDRLKAILVNIFGGIVRCDIIARGLVNASRAYGSHVPVILRLVGTHEEDGRRLIEESGVDVRWANDLDEAAELTAAVVREAA